MQSVGAVLPELDFHRAEPKARPVGRARHSVRVPCRDGGGSSLEDGARFEAAIAPILDRIFGQARAAERREPREAYAFDALIDAVCRDSPEPDTKHARKPRFLALLHLDVEALTDGREIHPASDVLGTAAANRLRASQRGLNRHEEFS